MATWRLSLRLRRPGRSAPPPQIPPVGSGAGPMKRSSLTFQSTRIHGLRSVAFPAISCGVYGYPLDRAARIAVGEMRRFLEREPEVDRVLVVCFGRDVYDAYHGVLRDLVPE